MIASKIIFQSLAGFATVGSVVGGGYYMFNLGENQYFLVSASETSTHPTKDLFTDEPPKPSSLPANSAGSLFLTVDSSHSSDTAVGTGPDTPAVVVVTTPPAADQQPSISTTPSQETPAVEEKTTTQNYTCKNADKKTEDTQCKLFTIKFDTTNKSIDLATINTFIKAQAEGKETNSAKITKTLNKSELTSKHFFILKSSTSLITQKMVEGKKTITLASTDKDGADKDKTYATLTVLANFKDEKAIGKTNLAVVKATSVDNTNATFTNASDSQKTYTCTLQNVDKIELKGCSIKELDSYSDSTALNFSSITLPLPSTSLTIAKDKHYLINWTTPQKLSSLKNKIHFSVQPTQPATQGETATTKTEPTFTELSFISAIFAHPTATAFSEVIIVNK